MTNTPPQRTNRPKFWAGMPTPTSKKFELFLGFYPIWIFMIGVTVAILLPIVQSCRDMARDRAGQAPPLNAERLDSP